MADAYTKPSLGRRWETYQPSKTVLFWACAATVVATVVVGFNWGGWVTGGTALKQSDSARIVAHVELGTALCVERFGAATDAPAQLAALALLTNSTERRQFVEAGGWATMPGQTAPDRLVATGCVTALTA